MNRANPLNNVTLQVKLLVLAALTALATAVLAIAALSAPHVSDRTLIVVAAGAVALLAVPGLLWCSWQVRRSSRMVTARLHEIADALVANVTQKTGMQAVADGDLTRRITARSSALNAYFGDEFGEMMRGAGALREACIKVYDSYNVNVDTLHALVGELQSTALSVAGTSQQLAANSEDTGRATTEISQAINEVAVGAERQAAMLADAMDATAHAAQTAQTGAENARGAADAAPPGADAHGEWDRRLPARCRDDAADQGLHRRRRRGDRGAQFEVVGD